MNQPTRSHRRRSLSAVALAGIGALALPVSSALTQEAEGSIEATRDVLGKYVETRRLISLERRDWAVGREVLQDRIDVVQREIDSLRERSEKAQEEISDVDDKREKLLAEKQQLADASSALADIVGGIEARTRTLLTRLPDPIVERVKPFADKIPQPDAEEVAQGLGQRYQNVVAILNEVNKFNREVSIHSEAREIGDGQSAEVTSLYVGIGQGYYVTNDLSAAGIGTATEEGWVWQPANEHAAQIQEAIEIHRNQKPAAFVRLPLQIQ